MSSRVCIFAGEEFEFGAVEEDLNNMIMARLSDYVFAAQEGIGITLTYVIVELTRNANTLHCPQQHLETFGGGVVDPRN
jgi:hypothetical protein